jgi:hypothetical protein
MGALPRPLHALFLNLSKFPFEIRQSWIIRLKRTSAPNDFADNTLVPVGIAKKARSDH